MQNPVKPHVDLVCAASSIIPYRVHWKTVGIMNQVLC